MKKLLLAMFLFTTGTVFTSPVMAQTTQKKKSSFEIPPLVVTEAAVQAVNTSSQFPPGSYDYYYLTFYFRKGVWETLAEYYVYGENPEGRGGTEWFYFKNNGTPLPGPKTMR